MPVLAKFYGIVIRMLVGPTIGTRLHAFHGNAELVIGLHPLRVIQSEVPAWVEAQVLMWARRHQEELDAPWSHHALPELPTYRSGAGSVTV
jgi:hypothetical protein